MKKLVVRAKEGQKCPMENTRGKHITETPMEVPDTPYYRGLLRDGSLVPAELKASPARDKARKKLEEAGKPGNRPPKPRPVPKKDKPKAEEAGQEKTQGKKTANKPPKPVSKGAKAEGNASTDAEGGTAAAADTADGAANMSPAGEPENK